MALFERDITEHVIPRYEETPSKYMPSPEGYIEKTEDYYVREIEQRRMDETLTHLVDSGRVEDREAAEQYLNTLNGIKDKLMQFIRDQVMEKPHTANIGSEDAFIQYGNQAATTADLAKITADDLDRIEPELWKLERRVDSSYTQLRRAYKDSLGVNEIGTRDRLRLDLTNHTAVEIYPEWSHRGAVVSHKLEQYLTEEDFAFMAMEYSFTAKDLAKVLRAAADRAASQTGPADAWERFSPRERK